MGKTPWGHIHHPPPPPSRALYPRREAPACVPVALRCWACAAGTRPGRCSSRPAGDLAIAMGCPGLPGFAGVASGVAELWAFCRRAACARNAVARAFRRFVSAPRARSPRPVAPRPWAARPRPRRRGRAWARRLRALRAAELTRRAVQLAPPPVLQRIPRRGTSPGAALRGARGGGRRSGSSAHARLRNSRTLELLARSGTRALS
jgi:hypothetical protein